MRKFNYYTLDGLVRETARRAVCEEAEWREKVYRNDYWMTLTFRREIRLDKAVADVKKFFVDVSRRLGRHLFWYGWYDTQPNRGLDGRVYTHFHIFVEVEGFSSVSPCPVGSSLVEFEFNGWDGDVDVRRYVNGGGAGEYTIGRHSNYCEGIACPRKKKACNKRDRVCLYVWRDGAFVNRHK